MFENGLLILSSSAVNIGKVLNKCGTCVRKVLYVHLLNNPECLQINQKNPLVYSCSKSVLSFITNFYLHSSKKFKYLDVKFILFNISNQSQDKLNPISLSTSCQVLLTDIHEQNHSLLKDYVKKWFSNFNLVAHIPIKCLYEVDDKMYINQKEETNSQILHKYNHVCVGGTFDRLHVGHKILLNQAVLVSKEKLTVGVTDRNMNNRKILSELIEPTEQRLLVVKSFLTDIHPYLKYDVLPITDIFGPSITDPGIDCLVVSEETVRGGELVNEERIKKDFPRLHTETVELVKADDLVDDKEETKISSSTLRKQLLGTLYRLPQNKENLQNFPYIIGLTGGIASGKTSVSKRLEGLGAGIINCDLLGHEAYLPGSDAWKEICKTFGDDIIDSSGFVNRKKLGGLVFSDKAKLDSLNMIVWPAIQKLVPKYIDELTKQGKSIIVLDAAVLLEAGWDYYVHEVWTTIIPVEEAEKRIMDRNKISLEQAQERIKSQLSNQERVNRSHVILCTLWEYLYTQEQVEKAWKLLLERIPKQPIV